MEIINKKFTKIQALSPIKYNEMPDQQKAS